MLYNLSKYSNVTSSGSIDLDFNDLYYLINTNQAGIEMTTSGTIVIDCDLGARVHISQLRYYHVPSTSGVEFYWKNESFEDYSGPLNKSASINYVYANTIDPAYAPQFIRVEHAVVSGTIINGFQVYNNEDYVDFGTNGNETSHNINATLETETAQIDALQVYNSSEKTATAKVFIEPQDTTIDELLFISDSSSGPWYGIYQDADKILGTTIWETATYTDTIVSSDIAQLDAGEPLGVITTRIFNLEDNQKLTHIIINNNYPVPLNPSIEFEDHFGNVAQSEEDWEETAGGTLIFNGSNMNSHIAVSGHNFGTVRKDYSFTDDWELTFRLRTAQTYWWSYRAYLANGTVQLRIDLSGPNSNAYIYINGAQRWFVDNDSTVNGWFNHTEWTYFTFRRTFNDFYFKHWKASESEPGSWRFTTTISTNDIAQTGDIKFWDDGDNSLVGDMYYDDIVLTKNFSTTGGNIYSLISTDADDTYESVEVRSSNYRPMDRDSYIYHTGSQTSSYCHYRFLEDGSLEETSDNWYPPGVYSYGDLTEVWHDSVTGDEYYVIKSQTAYFIHVVLATRRKNSSAANQILDYYSSSGGPLFWNTYKLTYNINSGFWIYFYRSKNSGNTSGTYDLRYYNAGGTLIYQRTQDSDDDNFMYDMSAVYTSDGDLWYTDVEINAVIKLDRTGAITATKAETDTIRGIVALDDGGCWYIRSGELVRLDDSALEIDTITLSTDTASYVYRDLDGEGFWLHDGDTIRFIYDDGTEKFNIVRSSDLIRIQPCHSGVLATEWNGADDEYPQGVYISKDYERVIRTFNYPDYWYTSTRTNVFGSQILGIRSHVYDDLTEDYASKFPIAPDAAWNAAEWKKVSLRNYNFSIEEYHQVRLTLRGTSSSYSPQIRGIWTQRAIELPNILPGNYATFYIKSDTSALTNDDVGTYTSNIRAWWFVEEN